MWEDEFPRLREFIRQLTGSSFSVIDMKRSAVFNPYTTLYYTTLYHLVTTMNTLMAWHGMAECGHYNKGGATGKSAQFEVVRRL